MVYRLPIILTAAAFVIAACHGAQRADVSRTKTDPPVTVADSEAAPVQPAVPVPSAPPVVAEQAKRALGAVASGNAFYRGAQPIRPIRPLPGRVYRENYEHPGANPVRLVAKQPVSTFSVDVDTASYANLRRLLNAGRLPPEAAVRVEEMVNYFDYHYAIPRDEGSPFGVTVAIAPTPWNDNTHLLHIGIQGWKPSGELAGEDPDDDPMSNVVGHSITYRIAVGPNAGRKVMTLQTLPADDPPFGEEAGKVNGFSLHAGVAARALRSRMRREATAG